MKRTPLVLSVNIFICLRLVYRVKKKNIYTEVQNDCLYNYRKLGYLEKEHTELMDASLNLKVTFNFMSLIKKKINKK